MDDKMIARINELYHKSKTEEGLTTAETIEQAELRHEYIMTVRKNLRGTLNNISLVNPDGTITDLKKRDKNE